jgi:hypothetical protein
MAVAELAGESGARLPGMVEGSGSGRLGTPNDIAAAVAFLLSRDASFITGTDLLLDGGAVAGVRHGVRRDGRPFCRAAGAWLLERPRGQSCGWSRTSRHARNT